MEGRDPPDQVRGDLLGNARIKGWLSRPLRNRWNRGPTRTLVHPGSYSCHGKGLVMDSIIYLVGLIVVIMFILSFLGLR